MRLEGIVIIVALCVAISKASLDDNVEPDKPAEKKGKRSSNCVGGKDPNSDTPCSDAIKEDPENTKKHTQYTQTVGFSGFQNMMDNKMQKYRDESEQIHAQGDKNRQDSKASRKKMEKAHYDQMYTGFKWAESSMRDGPGEQPEGDAGPPKGGKIETTSADERRNFQGAPDDNGPSGPIDEDDEDFRRRR